MSSSTFIVARFFEQRRDSRSSVRRLPLPGSIGLSRAHGQERSTLFGQRYFATGGASSRPTLIVGFLRLFSVLPVAPSPNFAYLTYHDARLAALATQAEQHFGVNPTVTLFKLGSSVTCWRSAPPPPRWGCT